MAGKKKSLKGKKWYATYKAESRFAKNQAAKRAKHAKRHPNDLQSVEKAKPGYKRKAANKPNATIQVVKYRDASGKVLAAPDFGRSKELTSGEQQNRFNKKV